MDVDFEVRLQGFLDLGQAVAQVAHVVLEKRLVDK